MIEIILDRSNQLVIQLNSLAPVPTSLDRTCINRRSVQTGHSTVSPGNPVWTEFTVHCSPSDQAGPLLLAQVTSLLYSLRQVFKSISK